LTDLRIRSFLAIGLAALIALTSTNPTAASSNLKAPERFEPQMNTLGACISKSEMDCIESVGLVTSDGKFHQGTWLGDSVAEPQQDSLGNAMKWGGSLWSVDLGDSFKMVRLTPNFESEMHRKELRKDGTYLNYGALRTHVYVDDPLNTKVRFALRTSWLKPLNVPMFAAEAAYKTVPITGGNRWIFEGKGMNVSSYSGNNQYKLENDIKADFDNIAFYFVIDHAGISDQSSAWPTACSELGYTATASNATMAAMPSWNSTSGTLNFNVYAPHRTSAGEDNMGFFRLWINEDFMNCRWPTNNLSSAPNVEIRIINADGSQQVAITTVAKKDGMLYLAATNFHYSNPRIEIKAATGRIVETVIPGMDFANATSAPVQSKNKTIICKSTKNNKLTKPVSGTSPKCPKGFVKK
jgi:hypothetical protein